MDRTCLATSMDIVTLGNFVTQSLLLDTSRRFRSLWDVGATLSNHSFVRLNPAKVLILTLRQQKSTVWLQ